MVSTKVIIGLFCLILIIITFEFYFLFIRVNPGNKNISKFPQPPTILTGEISPKQPLIPGEEIDNQIGEYLASGSDNIKFVGKLESVFKNNGGINIKVIIKDNPTPILDTFTIIPTSKYLAALVLQASPDLQPPPALLSQKYVRLDINNAAPILQRYLHRKVALSMNTQLIHLPSSPGLSAKAIAISQDFSNRQLSPFLSCNQEFAGLLRKNFLQNLACIPLVGNIIVYDTNFL